jgi:hypothetical protein
VQGTQNQQFVGKTNSPTKGTEDAKQNRKITEATKPRSNIGNLTRRPKDKNKIVHSQATKVAKFPDRKCLFVAFAASIDFAFCALFCGYSCSHEVGLVRRWPEGALHGHSLTDPFSRKKTGK